MNSKTQNVRERLVYHVHELERMEEARQAAAERFRDALANAKAGGFDAGTLKAVLRLRKLTPSQRLERRALEAIYLAALGMLEGDPLPDEARRRLDEQDRPPAPESQGPATGPDVPDQAPTPPPEPVPQLPLKTPDEARQDGRDAAGAGKRIYDNPFAAGDPCRAAWDEGWCEQRQSHGMETPAAYQRRSQPEEPRDKDDKDGQGKAA